MRQIHERAGQTWRRREDRWHRAWVSATVIDVGCSSLPDNERLAPVSTGVFFYAVIGVDIIVIACHISRVVKTRELKMYTYEYMLLFVCAQVLPIQQTIAKKKQEK